MSLTTTYLNGAVTATASTVTLNAYTAPTVAAIASKPWLQVDSEFMLITDSTNSPTLSVVRGYWGSQAVSHKTSAPVKYGLPADFPAYAPAGPAALTTPTIIENALDVTATGATGSTAAPITIPAPGVITATGASGAGINLPYATAGAEYQIKNMMTGVLKVYSLQATINGNSGATGYSITATGNLTALAFCTVAGAWQIGLNT